MQSMHAESLSFILLIGFSVYLTLVLHNALDAVMQIRYNASGDSDIEFVLYAEISKVMNLKGP